MSLQLLQRVSGHLNDAGLLTGYDVLYFKWTDERIEQNTPFILFRMAGTSGADNQCVQFPDVRILLVGSVTVPDDADTRAYDILRHFRTDFDTPTQSVKYFEPLGQVVGPMYLENGRPVFEINVRCMVDDH